MKYIKTPFFRKLENLKEIIFPSDIYKEEAFAFADRLPNRIKVGWFRDGKFIIGEIIDGNNTYYTQAKSAKEFVEMVNDAIYSVYGVKQKYFKILGEDKYHPTEAEFERLNNGRIPNAQMNLVKQTQPT